MLQSGLTVWCYTSDGSVVVGYQRNLENIEFSTAAPGGFGTLRATIKLPDARIPHPELATFSRIAVMGHGYTGPYAVWLGEIMDAPLVLNTDGGEAVEVQALGIGNCLRDDPLSFAYSSRTAQQVATDQLTGATSLSPVTWRANAWPLDQDSSALFPDNPGTAYSLSYTNRNAEEILGDICTLAGSSTTSYIWGTRAHPRNTDAAGFPTGQLYAMLQDTATTAYQASLMARDIATYRVTPSSDRAYNVVKITYNDPASGGIGTAVATDPRLGASGAQGTASFRRRVYVRELSGIATLSAVNAQQIANQMAAQYENVTNKVELVLMRVRNAQGVEIPLWAVAAGPAGNIYVPELAVRGSQLATGAVAGVNQFFIISSSYREGGFSTSSNKYDMSLTLECDNYTDSTATQVARLQLLADSLARVQRTTGNGTATGVQVKGWYEVAGQASGASQVLGAGVTYPNAPLSAPPTSITLSSAFSTNNTGLRYTSAGVYGFNVLVMSSAAGAVENNGTWLTNGNCIRDVDLAAGTFTHHCDGTFWTDRRALVGRVCDTTRRGLRIETDVRVHTDEHGQAALVVECPICGSVEGFNPHLGAEDEDGAGEHGAHHHRAEQARHIRALMRHPAVGLHAMVRDCRCTECAGQEEGREASGSDGGHTGSGGARRRRADVSRGDGGRSEGADDRDAATARAERSLGGAPRGDAAPARRTRGARREAER